MSASRILIVDDDPDMVEIIRVYCEKEGFQVATARSCEEADDRMRHFSPDVIVLDIMLREENGIDWCRAVRRSTRAVILFLSSREEDETKIRALGDGGDDYVTKPFSPKVLMAKIKAHLRRTSSSASERYLELPGLKLDFVAQNVFVSGKLVHLSKKEFGILAHMAQFADQVVVTSTLFQLIWGLDSLEDTRTVAVHISNLRKKIEEDPSDPKRLVNVRGIGYKLVSDPAAEQS
jgi:DNA-binding response OmpR family regulator